MDEKSLIDQISFLAAKVGNVVKPDLIDAFLVDKKDIISIHDAARRIAQFIGLDDLKIIISRTCNVNGRGGQVELDISKDLFIEVNPTSSANVLLATLAHEIAHKFLHIHFIYPRRGLEKDLEHERLTDIAVMFLGLGPLLLRAIDDAVKIGYLDLEEMAFVYTVCCWIRGISSARCYASLPESATRLLNNAMVSCHARFILFQDKKRVIDWIDINERHLHRAQSLLATIHKHLNHINTGICARAGSFLEKHHGMIKQFKNVLARVRMNVYGGGPAEDVERLALLKEQLWLNTVDTVPVELEGFYNGIVAISVLLHSMGPPFLPMTGESCREVVCHIDKVGLRVPSNEQNRAVKCPGCGYHFIVDSHPGHVKDKDREKALKIVKKLARHDRSWFTG